MIGVSIRAGHRVVDVDTQAFVIRQRVGAGSTADAQTDGLADRSRKSGNRCGRRRGIRLSYFIDMKDGFSCLGLCSAIRSLVVVLLLVAAECLA